MKWTDSATVALCVWRNSTAVTMLMPIYAGAFVYMRWTLEKFASLIHWFWLGRGEQGFRSSMDLMQQLSQLHQANVWCLMVCAWSGRESETCFVYWPGCWIQEWIVDYTKGCWNLVVEDWLAICTRMVGIGMRKFGWTLCVIKLRTWEVGWKIKYLVLKGVDVYD